MEHRHCKIMESAHNTCKLYQDVKFHAQTKRVSLLFVKKLVKRLILRNDDTDFKLIRDVKGLRVNNVAMHLIQLYSRQSL